MSARPAAVPVDDRMFRTLMRSHATTVTVITAPGNPATHDAPAGFTATSFVPVSLVPPLVCFCIGNQASSFPIVIRADHVAVHLLADHQQEVAERFAARAADRFAHPTTWRYGPHQVPLLDEALVWLVCRVVRHVPAGDHTVVLAEPVLAQRTEGARPLLYHDGRYTGLPAQA